jgi:hypothetical protein
VEEADRVLGELRGLEFEQLVGRAELGLQEFRLDLPFVGAPHRPVPPPHDASPDAQPALHARQQLDQTQVVELGEQDALLALVERVLAPHFGRRPVIENQIEGRKQVRITG